MIVGDGGHAKVIRSFYSGRSPIVAIGDNKTRKRVVQEMGEDEFTEFAIHPKAIVAEYVPIGVGTVIMAGAIVQPGANIGRHVILNTGCSVDHDTIVEDYAHIAPGAHLCGGVRVGEGALVGVGVGVAPGGVIPPWTLVKARSLEFEPVSGN